VIFKEAFGVALNNHVLYFFPLFPFFSYISITRIHQSRCSIFLPRFYHIVPRALFSYMWREASAQSSSSSLRNPPCTAARDLQSSLHRKPFLGQLVAPLHLINKPCNHRPRDVVWLARRSRTLPRPQVNMVSARLSAATNSNLKQRTALFFAFDVFWLFHS
jgi:hypothetical protein